MAILATAALTLVPAGCGGGGGRKAATRSPASAQQVVGTGFRFSAPSGWRLERGARSVTLHASSGPSLASVTLLDLRRRYRPALFARTASALDRVTDALAARLGGSVVDRRTLEVGGIRARQYDVRYARAGATLVDRITYVLRGKTEYYLLCRWPAGESPPAACSLLTATFRPQ